ncbi:aminopeptidase P family protein [Terrarubrum flagellatum]|uniref:aminopeptidase P family protein n=1 Tax=Terrirubrum flagellatum TaxID=2895980 RepID=UPI0031454F44
MSSQFQSFEDKSEGARGPERAALLRAELKLRGVDGFIVPRADEHQGEYVPKNAERLAWLTGFTGSAGTAVVLEDKAAIFVDGRYTLQAAEQVDTKTFAVVASMQTTPEAWIESNLPEGAKLGFDPWLVTSDGRKKFELAAKKAGGSVVALERNPLDAVWKDRPPAPRAPVFAQDAAFAGEDAASKLKRVREALAKERCAALVVSDPHSLCWLFNIRGGDVGHTPLALGYAVVAKDEAILFMDAGKLDASMRGSLSAQARIVEPSALAGELAKIASDGAKIRIDSASGGSQLATIVEKAGGAADVGADPIARMKAAKNEAELSGARAAHLRDGAAMTRFLSWFDEEAPKGGLTEIGAAEKLEEYRRATNLLHDLSFPSISAAGPNAALPHYRVSTKSNRKIEPGIFLIDSGAQYRDGTTDITRTVSVAEVTDEMKDRYTRVLKGHIAIATVVFPEGTSGAQLDSLARLSLWSAGLDFDHGTGHGIGSFLSVHEGPQRLSKLGTATLEPGMILSNEPGFYKTNDYGIRIENILVVERREIPGGDRKMLGFETISFAPIDLALIKKELLTADEIAWLNSYHARTREKLAPLVDGAALEWLEKATRAI